MKSSIVLLSGGLDSATALYLALSEGYQCRCLIFDYGQRHQREIEAAKAVARRAKCAYEIVKIKLPWGGSSLLDKDSVLGVSGSGNDQGISALEKNRGIKRTGKLKLVSGYQGIPDTYVPARNIIFLSFALSYAEATEAKAIFIGAHAQDYSGYPDCRPEFFRSFGKVITTGTKAGVQKRGIVVKVPLQNKNKSQIIKLGFKLNVPFELTWSCYKGGGKPCGKCDSCYYRAKGFKEAGLSDPAKE